MKARRSILVGSALLTLVLLGCQTVPNGRITPTAQILPPAETIATEDAAPPLGGSGTTAGALGAGVLGAATGAEADTGGGDARTMLAGTLAGGYFGDRIGNRFHENARVEAARAERQALVSNASASWNDPQSDASGRVRPIRTFMDAAGRQCREYSHAITIQGRARMDTGIACRQSDGNWSLVGS